MLYRVLFHYFERFLSEYESRFKKEYGFLRPIIKEVLERYLDCGNPRCGFARVRCPECGSEFLLHFSWRSRGSNPLICPKCQGEMRIIAFLTDYAVVDRIINYLKLTFVAERPPPPHISYPELLIAAEAKSEYFL